MREASVTVVDERSESLPHHFLPELLKPTNIPNPCVKNLTSRILQKKHKIARKVKFSSTIKVIKIFHGSKMSAVFSIKQSFQDFGSSTLLQLYNLNLLGQFKLKTT